MHVINPSQAKDDSTVLDIASEWEMNVSRYITAMVGKTFDAFM